MSDRKIGSILSQLKHAQRFEKREAPKDADASIRPTSLGVPLRRSSEAGFSIDLSDIQVLTGIPELAHMLCNQFFEQCRIGSTDIMAQHTINDDINPELAREGVRHITLYTRNAVAHGLQRNRPEFTARLHTVINALQNKRVRDNLFGAGDTTEPIAWLFPFDAEDKAPGYFLLLEFEAADGFLRITVEFNDSNRLFLKRIPHRLISEQDQTLYGQDLGKLTEIILLGIHHACQNQRETYSEDPRRQPAIFDLLARSGLEQVHLIRFTWLNKNMSRFLLGQDPGMQALVSKMLMLLEDAATLQTLAEHHAVELISGPRHAFLYLSRRDACLNIAIDHHRPPADLNSYLTRMPHLNRFASGATAALEQVRILFIHHLTAETLGCIQALEKMNCAHMHGLFIRYKGVTPDAYLDALFSLPEERFVFHSLHNLGDEETLSGHYVLSRQFSPIDRLQPLPDFLRATPNNYFAAMRITACHLFLRQVIAAKQEGSRVLLVEDGGYVAPVLNIWTQNNMTIAEALAYGRINPETFRAAFPDVAVDGPLAGWLGDTFLASVEHTRNGYDQLAKVKRTCGQLTYPAYTIAISDYKNVEEGRGAAMSILMACEEIMNGQGDSLFPRSGVVIGSHGNIGRFVLSHLVHRLAPGQAVGVDIVAPPSGGQAILCDAPEYPTLDDIPDATLLETDLFIGMTGLSVLQPATMETLLLRGVKNRIYLVSGSTKNLEFAAVITWLQEFRGNDYSIMGHYTVHIETLPLLDPLTENSQGTRIRVHFLGPTLPPGTTREHPYKDILLLADGMPLNFNFFGVPSEIIDRVMMQLMQMCVLGATQPRGATPPPADLYVLDYTIDEAGNPITGRTLP
ncbi:MAG: hypothetical protein EOM20_09785 [Spartobacteria bacterium]|nr:hypothetical protein [Spartobacteria bacterium]